MFIDSQHLFSDGQALTATAASTNIIDIGIARNLFDGEPLCVVLVPTVSADITTGDETYAVALQSCASSGFGSSVTTHVSATIAAALLAASSKYVLPIPIGGQFLQYVRLNYTLGGTTPSVTLKAFLMPLSMVDKFVSYADNSTIS
jgi:hypothetical protein